MTLLAFQQVQNIYSTLSLNARWIVNYYYIIEQKIQMLKNIMALWQGKHWFVFWWIYWSFKSCFQTTFVLIKHFLFLLAKAHLHSALKSHEEAMKARQICRHCRKIAGLQKVNAFSLQRNTVFGILVRCQFLFYNNVIILFFSGPSRSSCPNHRHISCHGRGRWLRWSFDTNPYQRSVRQFGESYYLLFYQSLSLIIIVNWSKKGK